MGRWPKFGGWVFDPFEIDAELPSGTYRLYFVSSQTSGIPLPTEHGRPSPDIEWQNPKAPVSLDDEEAALDAAEQMASSEDLPELARDTQKPELRAAPAKGEDLALRRHRREVEQERFARDIADSRLLLGQKMRHAGESAELLVVMRSYRTELEKATRMPMAIAMEFLEAAKRSHTEYNAMFGDMLKKNGELAKLVAELQKATPAPPPPSFLAQIASPEGLSLARFLAEVVTGRGGDDSDTVMATEEDPDLKRLRKKRDEARAKLKRLQSATKKGAESKGEPESGKGGKAKRKKEPLVKKARAEARSKAKPNEKQSRAKTRTVEGEQKTPPKRRSRPIKGTLTGGDGT